MIRNLQEKDFAEILKLHQDSGAQFELPNLKSPLVLVKKVVDDGGVKMAAIGELHITAIMWVDKNWKTPRERLDAMQELQHEMMLEASGYGLNVVTTQADGRFAERLEEMGWTEGIGRMFYRSLS